MFLYDVDKFTIWHLEKNKGKIRKFGLMRIRNTVLILYPTLLTPNVRRYSKIDFELTGLYNYNI